MNGDEVRDTRFLGARRTREGYHGSEVYDLLRHIAAELDAGRPAGPLLASATFRRAGKECDVDAVDWFLEQLLRREDRSELAGMDADPWRDLPVGNHFVRKGLGNPDDRPAEAGSRRARRKYHSDERKQGREYFFEECNSAWGDFDQQPGTYLRWAWVGPALRELLTMEVQTIASLRGHKPYRPKFLPRIVRAGERSFTFRMTGATGSSPPGIAEIAARSTRDGNGHFAAEETKSSRKQEMRARHRPRARFPELVDESGTPILYLSGMNYDGRAWASISFSDQRWLRFLVRGIRKANAIMTAVDQAGNKVARYRLIYRGFGVRRSIVEIAVHPDRELSDELVLALAVSAPWLGSYFDHPQEGGAG